MGIDLVVGLGNAGAKYAETRHNAGFRFVARLQRQYGFDLAMRKKLHGEAGSFVCGGRRVRVLLPMTMMNGSGAALAATTSFYGVDAARILVVHDELDLPPGVVRLKRGGGHGGHNGLRDIVARLGDNAFCRLRIGIGHPGVGRDVAGYVLRRPAADEAAKMEAAMTGATDVFEDIVGGNFDAAMRVLHGVLTPP